MVEGVRQMRGDSTLPVEGARTCLVSSGPGVAPVSDVILHN